MENKTVPDLEIGKQETLLRTRVASIVAARVRNRRTGREDEFYRLEFPDWVNVVAITEENEIVLIRQFRFGSLRVELEIPGGAVEPGESPLAAARRELLEETGYAGEKARLIGEVNPNPAIQHNRCFTVLVEDVACVARQNMDEMEDIEVMTVPYARVEELIALGQISHGLVLNALMFYERSRNDKLDKNPLCRHCADSPNP